MTHASTQRHTILQSILTTSMGDKRIAANVGVSKTTVAKYRRACTHAGITQWAQVKGMKPEELGRLLTKRPATRPRKRHPDWVLVHEAMKEPGTTLLELWEAYRHAHPDATLKYSRFAECYARHVATLPKDMRKHYPPGEEAQVDYSGTRPHFQDDHGGQVYAEMFVGVLPNSRLTYAECTRTQSVPDFIGAHARMMAFFGGVPLVLVCDNLKSGVSKARTRGVDPSIQRSYQDFARYHDIVVIPARVRKPKDKAPVERAVGIIKMNILPRLNRETFHSLEALNASLATHIERLNNRVMVRNKMSRRQLFDLRERAALRPIPTPRYDFNEVVEIKSVLSDYHVCIKGHFSSVPHALVGQRLDARVSATTVDIIDFQTVVATHARNDEPNGTTTSREHMPANHLAQAERNPEGIQTWASECGGAVEAFILHQFNNVSQPYHAMKTCDHVRTAVSRHGLDRVQRACHRALTMKCATWTSLQRFLTQGGANPSTTVNPGRTRGTPSTETIPHVRFTRHRPGTS